MIEKADVEEAVSNLMMHLLPIQEELRISPLEEDALEKTLIRVIHAIFNHAEEIDELKKEINKRLKKER